MHCIRCKSDMVKNKLKGVLIDYCKNCDAFWLDQGELEALESGMAKSESELRGERVNEMKLERLRPVTVLSTCPKCQEGQIKERNMDGVRVDYCNNCRGLYFDHGELQQILENRKQGFFDRLMTNLFG